VDAGPRQLCASSGPSAVKLGSVGWPIGHTDRSSSFASLIRAARHECRAARLSTMILWELRTEASPKQVLGGSLKAAPRWL